MPTASQVDSLHFDTLFLPYDKKSAELSPEPRLFAGSNVVVTLGGKLIKRAGTTGVTNGVLPANKRVDRVWLYETLESPPKVFILASVFDTVTSNWAMFYNRLSGGSPGWTSMGTLRQVNTSTAPHVIAVSRGLAFIKGFPTAASGEKLGSVIFDGSGASPTLKLWGLLGPTVPAAVVGAVSRLNADLSATATSFAVTVQDGTFPAAPFIVQVDFEQMNVTAVAGVAPNLTFTVTRGVNGTSASTHDQFSTVLWRNWTASSNRVEVDFGWVYSYAWKTSTGQYSNRAPVQTDPQKLPSLTGPFVNLAPSMTLQGNADTTNIPTVAVLRSTDGGGSFNVVREVSNPGAGAFTFRDQFRNAGNNDPLDDATLSTNDFAPSLTDHSPPPSVAAPNVVGIDTPALSSPMETYAARIWFAVGNILFYSAQEETVIGIPEESFPSGIRGNFFRFTLPITNLKATSNALYVFTPQETFVILGTNRESFAARPLLSNIGHPYGHQKAITKYGNTIVVLTQDLRIAAIEGFRYRIISDALFTDILDQINAPGATGEVDFVYWAAFETEWLVVGFDRTDDPSKSVQWVYDIQLSEDLRKDFWSPPWTVGTSCLWSGRILEGTSVRKLGFFPFASNAGRMTVYDETRGAATDTDAAGLVAGFTFSLDTSLLSIPAGNHVNELKRPDFAPTAYRIRFNRTLFAGDSDPQVFYFLDDLYTDPIPAPLIEDPPRTADPKGYRLNIWQVENVCQRIAVRVQSLSSVDRFEMLDFAVVWNPDSGA